MKQLYTNLKKGEIKVQVETMDDLWFLSQIIEPKDFVSGKTLRKIKIGGEEQRSANIVKKPIFVKIEVEKLELASDSLRVSGKIIEGPEDVSRGVYHTLTIEQATKLLLTKEHWFSYQLDRIKEACSSKPTNILICLMDREEAYFAKLKTQGYGLITRLKGEVTKKAQEQKIQKDFYQELVKTISEYDKRFSFSQIIIASPSFWKEELMERIKEKVLQEKIILATSSSVSIAGLNEVLRRPEVLSALHEERIAEEIDLVEDLLSQIAKDGPMVYGEKEVQLAVEAGAVSKLLIADAYLTDKREKGIFSELEDMMKTVEKHRGKVHIISTEHEAGKKLQGLGGIAALLRYKVS